MNVLAIFTDLQNRGLQLQANGDRLRVTPKSRLTDELRTVIRTHKAALLRALRQADAETLGAEEKAKDAKKAPGGDPTKPTKPSSDGFVGTPRNASQNFNELTRASLADKLRIYGKPWPLKINGEVKCWLVPDDAAARACKQSEPVYTAAEVNHLVTLPAADVQQLHKIKARFGGTIYPPKGQA